MKSFTDKIVVVTGGGTGMGRELVRQLTAEGARVATCDVSVENMEETVAIVERETPGADVLIHHADVSSESDLESFRDAILQHFDTDHIHAVFNNAGIAGGGSMFAERANWDRTFAVTWGGVYLGCRVFLPFVVAAPEGLIVNTSSVNGFYASFGKGRPHTAYSAAKFAVKGFTEALMEDLEVNAPHVRAAVVMPGHIGTQIITNSMRARVIEPTPEEAELQLLAAKQFETLAPMTGEEAAKVILDAVKAGKWRILVGADAHELDEAVRSDPENAYERDLFRLLG